MSNQSMVQAAPFFITTYLRNNPSRCWFYPAFAAMVCRYRVPLWCVQPASFPAW